MPSFEPANQTGGVGALLIDRSPAWISFWGRALFLTFLLLPFLVAIPVSFSFLPVFPPKDMTMKWYVEFFTSREFNNGWKVSLILALASATISTLAGTCFALALARSRIPGRVLLMNLTMSPLVVPGVATGVGFVFLFTQIGLVNGWARLLLAHVIITTPYAVRVVSATLYAFDRSLEQAAMNLGATELTAFRTITIPILKPGVIAAFLFAFMASFDNLSITIFVAQPGQYTIPVLLFGYVRDQFTPLIAVATVVMVGVAAFTLLIADRLVGVRRFIQLHHGR